MAPLALALHLAVAAPGLPPRLDPGPFRPTELAAASAGVFAGDLLVAGAGYLTLQLFARGALDPNAANFRRTAYGLGAAALLVPPLTAVLLGRWARAEPASGAAWKALLLATVGNVAAVAVGLAASPHYWVIVPVQLLAVAAGTSIGLHWGPARRERERAPEARRAPEPAGTEAATRLPRAQCAVG
jgi:hypothetical protein